MTRSSRYALLFCLGFFAIDPSHLLACDCPPYFTASFGYRSDRLNCQSTAYDATDTFLLSEELTVKKIGIYEGGIQVWLPIGHGGWIAGKVNVGTVFKGQYDNDIQSFSPTVTQAQVGGGNSQDAWIGLGYLLPLHDCLKVGPMVGWSYDRLSIKMRQGTENGIDDPILQRFTYKNRWKGAYVGFLTCYSVWNLHVNAGYEYHWPTWNASWTLGAADLLGSGFSDQRKAQRASGQVAALLASYSLCPSWEIGLAFEYRLFKASHGRQTPRSGSFAEVGEPDVAYQTVESTRWQSYGVQACCSYLF